MTGKRKTFDVGRDSGTGQFITVEEARQRKREAVVERVPKAGYGDTKSRGNKK